MSKAPGTLQTSVTRAKWAQCRIILLCLLSAACNPSPELQASRDVRATTAQSLRQVAVLPLQRGYYVASDTPCAKASNATLLLLRRNGIGGARYFCEFKRIEQTGPATYRVEEECADFQGDAPETRHLQYILDNDSRFLAKEQDVVALDARYCAQAELPLEWRNTDIESEIE